MRRRTTEGLASGVLDKVDFSRIRNLASDLLARLRHWAAPALRRSRRVFRFVGYALTAIAAVIAFLAGVNVPQDFWSKAHPWTLVVAAIWVGYVAISESIRRARIETGAQMELRIIAICKTTLVDVARIATVDITQLTVRAYLIRRPPYLLWERVLKCIGSISLRIIPPERSNVVWSRGTGIMGLCWENAEVQHHLRFLAGDTNDIANAAKTLSASDWADLSPLQRGGLSQAQAATLGHYGAILVYPMVDSRGAFRGCIVVEGPSDKLADLCAGEVLDYLEQQQQRIWLTLVAGDRQ